jgi:hypothetical protein
VNGSLFRVFFFATLGLAIAWAAWLFLPPILPGTEARDDAAYRDAFPGQSPAPSGPLVILDSPLPKILFPVGEEALRSARTLIARRLTISTALLPFWILFLGVSSLAGAVLRERLHLAPAYASPAASFISKRIAETALVVFFLWSFAPLPLPYWVFYPALLSAMISVMTYIANLPLRL